MREDMNTMIDKFGRNKRDYQFFLKGNKALKCIFAFCLRLRYFQAVKINLRR